MIEKFSIPFGLNDYADLIPDENYEAEKEQLLSEGYLFWSKYERDGQPMEMWMK